MSDALDRFIEIHIVDEAGRRVQGAKLTCFAGNGQKLVTLESTRDKPPTIRITGGNAGKIRIDVEYYDEIGPDGERLRILPCPYVFRKEISENEHECVFVIPYKNFAKIMFIGSSAEGKSAALLLQYELEQVERINTVLWSQGVFGLSYGTLETLVDKKDFFTHAALLLTQDDMVIKRGKKVVAARDNVLFELGLFMGSLGRDRTFIIAEKSVDLPTDLAGITVARFERTKGITANMGTVATQILRALKLL